jgi:hypothetical protein
VKRRVKSTPPRRVMYEGKATPVWSKVENLPHSALIAETLYSNIQGREMVITLSVSFETKIGLLVDK